MNDAAVALSPETVLGEMKKNGVTHVVYLPDSETNWLYLLMKADPAIHLVGVNREGHASSIAAGLWGAIQGAPRPPSTKAVSRTTPARASGWRRMRLAIAAEGVINMEKNTATQ